MHQIRWLFPLGAALALLTAPAHAQADRPVVPDQIDLKDGRSLHGLILKNTASTLVFQTADKQLTIPKSEIRRIREEADRDVYIDQVTTRGRLPSWRAIIHDFRDHELVWRLQLIPATAITAGPFKNIPYLSFNVNRHGILNIYGPPEDPIAIQFGIYGKKGRSERYHQMVREFLAGHLHSRREVATLYSLSLRGDDKRADSLGFKITPPGAPEANGAWFVTVYDPARLERSRLNDKAYAAVTRPFNTVHLKDGSLRPEILDDSENWFARAINFLPAQIPKIRGFFRDKDGVFHIMRLGSSS